MSQEILYRSGTKQIQWPKDWPIDTRTVTFVDGEKGVIIIAHPDRRPHKWNLKTQRWNKFRPPTKKDLGL